MGVRAGLLIKDGTRSGGDAVVVDLMWVVVVGRKCTDMTNCSIILQVGVIRLRLGLDRIRFLCCLAVQAVIDLAEEPPAAK